MSSSNSDPQKWVWPPVGDEIPPLRATANFGPVNKGDSMIIQWAPETNPVIQMSCFSASSVSSEHWVSSSPARTPYSFTFLETADARTATEQIFCHMWFHNTTMGNTVTWEYNNTLRDKAVTFSGSALSVTTSTQSISSTSSSSAPPSGTNTSTLSSTPLPSTSPSGTPSPSSPSSAPQRAANPSGLTTGAKAGIAVGVTLGGLGFILGALALFLMLQRSHKRKDELDRPHELARTRRDVVAEKEAPLAPRATPEARASPPAELPGSHGGHEIDGVGVKRQPV